MTTLESSDSGRSAAKLKHAEYARLEAPLALEHGDELTDLVVCYETYGTLNEKRDNTVLICHALSGDSHVARHDEADDPGWWDLVVGPGKPIDTDACFVICPNSLGSCRGTTGPNALNPSTGHAYGQDFPTITVGDIVETQRRLLEHLGIDKLLAVVGASMGGQQALQWGVKHPDMAMGTIAIATAPRITSQALAFDVVGRNAILHDPNFHDGQYYDQETGPKAGLAIARMIGHVTYLSGEAMQEKFEADRFQPREVATTFEKTFSVGSYLGHQGDKFVERFDANSYLCLTKAMDLFDLGHSPDALAQVFSASTCRWLLLSFSSDWLFPPAQSQDMTRALIAGNRPVTYCNVSSNCGHDAFLLPEDFAVYGELIRGFMRNLIEPCVCAPGSCGRLRDPDDPPGEASIFSPDRLDYEHIVRLIPKDASVLDLGCGKGELLCRLRQRGNRDIMGVERNENALLSCVWDGQNVIHADLNEQLSQFADGQFDYVVLSRTLQAVKDIDTVLSEMLRIGRKGIVSFPNFAYYKLRDMLAKEGRAPESTGVLRHKWYNTPNLRFFSIADFAELCQERGIVIHEMLAMETETRRDVVEDPNLNADLAILVLSRQ
ncbi:MAG: homoserine O-acetyltransferase [Lentisphaeria bacterium]|nr:homoserine O-acetyltransferase [Lentisphaeria bacterium]